MVSTQGLLTDRNKDNSLITACFKCVPALVVECSDESLPGFDAEEVILAGVSGWTIVTASGFPAKFRIRGQIFRTFFSDTNLSNGLERFVTRKWKL